MPTDSKTSATFPPYAQWVEDVSKATGLDPRVLVAWTRGEGHPGDTAYNWLNITATTARARGVEPSQTLAANTAGFSDLASGEKAAIAEIKALGITDARATGTPRQEIIAIASSPWASSHYSATPSVPSTWGTNLLNTFSGIFSDSALDSKNSGYQGGASVAETAGKGSAADWTSSDITGSGGKATPIVTDTYNAGKDVYNAALAVPKALAFLFSYRGLEVIGGGLLVLVGIVGLLKEVGAVPSLPGPLKSVPAVG